MKPSVETGLASHSSIRYPGYKKFFWLIKDNRIKDCEITLDDAKRSLHLYGPEEAVVMGRTTRTKQSRIQEVKMVSLPQRIVTKHKEVHLFVDHMYVQGVPFLTTISKEYNFRTVEPLMHKHKANKNDMVTAIQRIIKMYHVRGLTITQITSDNDFNCIRDNIRPIFLNVVAADEHVSPVERSIRTIKDRTRCHVHNLPYSHYPKTLMAGCVISATKALNNEVGMSTLSNEHSPFTLVTGYPQRSHKEIIQLSFGDYVHVHTTNEVSNTMDTRTIPAIALYPSGNLQQGWKFMSLHTGRVIHQRHWERTVASKKIIDRVNEMGKKESQRMVSSNFKYRWSSEQDDEDSEQEDENEVHVDAMATGSTTDEINDILYDEVEHPSTQDDVRIYDANDDQRSIDNASYEDQRSAHDDVENVSVSHIDKPAHRTKGASTKYMKIVTRN